MVRGHEDVGDDDRLTDLVDFVRRGEFCGIVHVLDLAVGACHLIDHRRCAGDQGQLVLALEPLLDDVHVQ